MNKKQNGFKLVFLATFKTLESALGNLQTVSRDDAIKAEFISSPTTKSQQIIRRVAANAVKGLGLILLGAASIASAQLQRSFINSSFEVPGPGTTRQCYSALSDTTVPGWATTHTSAYVSAYNNCVNQPDWAMPIPGATLGPIIETWNNSYNGVVPRQGVVLAELNAEQNASLYQNVCIQTGERVRWKLSHRGRDGVDRMAFVISSTATGLAAANLGTTATTGGVLNASSGTSGTGTINSCQTGSNLTSSVACTVTATTVGGTTWQDYAGDFIWNGTTANYFLGFGAISSSNGNPATGNLLDAVNLFVLPFIEFANNGSGSGAESVSTTLPLGLKVTGTFAVATPVSISVTGGSAVLGADFTTPTGTATFTVLIPAGDYDGTTTIPLGVTILQDSILEGSETITFAINTDPAYIIASTQACGAAPVSSATYTILDDDADMSVVVSGLPATSAPGATVTGKISCSAASTGASATAATCSASAVDSTGAPVAVVVSNCSPVPPTTLAAGTAISCDISYVTPGTAGGSDVLPTAVTVTGTTSASNDRDATNNIARATVAIIDAVDDSVGYPGGTTGATTNLATNDQFPSGSTFSIVAGGTCAGASVSPTGTATYTVPNSGSCTVLYQVCAPGGAPCDTATLTVVGTPSDMKPTFSNLPPTSAPGSNVTGKISCTNVITGANASTATAATCSATAVDSAGTPIPVTVTNCVAPPPTNVAVGASIVCDISYTTPGTVGGSDTAPTSVTLTGISGAVNDNNAGNDTTVANVSIIDAVNDTATVPGGTLSAQTNIAANDSFPVGSVFSVVGGTCASASVAAIGMATYDAPASGSCTVLYQVCAPGGTPCDFATLTVTASTSDVSAAVSAPAAAAPGSTVTGTITCTNSATSTATATAATCTPSAVDSANNPVAVTLGTCTPPQPVAALAAGEAIVCTVTYTVPGATGGADSPAVTSVTLSATAAAANDTVATNNAASAVTTIIDALHDVDSAPGGTLGATTNLSINDQVPAGSAFSLVSTGTTCPNASVSATGTALYDVPASGSCVVNYQVCAPSPNQTQCDTATLTITATPADMSAAVSAPSSASPGATVSGTITCTNNAGTAIAATCTASALDSANNSVPVTVTGCTPTPPATLALGQQITCNVSYTMPGAVGGANDPAITSVVLTAVTGAANDNNAANNTAPATTGVIDAVNDSAVTPFGTAGSISVLGNDQNGAATATTANVAITQTVAPTAGSSFNAATGVFSVPATAAPGTYTVTYQICATPATVPPACDTATATIVVAAPGAPVATNDAGATTVNTSLTVATPVTSNDSGTNIKVRDLVGALGQRCTAPMNKVNAGDVAKAGASCVVGGVAGVTCTVATAHGSVTMCQDGTYTYTPARGYIGTDSFDYQIVDAANQTATATVNLTISAVPDVTTKVKLPSVAPAAGQPLTVGVEFGNIGPVAATNMIVTLQLPAGLSGVVPSNGGVYDAATGLVTWPPIASVAANTPLAGTYTVTLPMPSAGLSASSNASVAGVEATTANNASTAALSPEQVAVPTMSNWMLIIMLILVMLIAARQSRRSMN